MLDIEREQDEGGDHQGRGRQQNLVNEFQTETGLGHGFYVRRLGVPCHAHRLRTDHANSLSSIVSRAWRSHVTAKPEPGPYFPKRGVPLGAPPDSGASRSRSLYYLQTKSGLLKIRLNLHIGLPEQVAEVSGKYEDLGIKA